jgi:hypothetical protein
MQRDRRVAGEVGGPGGVSQVRPEQLANQQLWQMLTELGTAAVGVLAQQLESMVQSGKRRLREPGRPSRANATATVRPMPLSRPVMIAFFPSKR